MYFVEKRNRLAIKINAEVVEMNKNRPKVIIKDQLQILWGSFRKVWVPLMYLLYVYVVTFCVFPGVTNYTDLTFLKKDNPWHEILFITTANLFDTLGRFLGH